MVAVPFSLCHTVRMDLDRLLADLSARFDAERREEMDILVDELADVECARVTMSARLLATRGSNLNVLLRGGERMAGIVRDCAREWIVIDNGVHMVLIPAHAIVAAWPLGSRAADESALAHEVAISHVLRALRDENVYVVIDHEGGQHAGYVCAVMGDHFDLESMSSGQALDTRDFTTPVVMSLSTGGIRTLRAPSQMAESLMI